MQTPVVSVIIISYNVRYFLELCLDSVFRSLEGIASEVIVVDNNSEDDSVAMLRKHFPQAITIANEVNTGFSKANNQAINIAKGKYIHILNPDTVVPEDYYNKTISFMEKNPDIGGVGPRLIDGKGKFSVDAKKSFPSFWPSVYKVTGLGKLFPHSAKFNKYYAAHIAEHQVAEIDILSGCCMMVSKEALDAAGGGFDEQYFMYCEDVDLCYRIQQAGFKNYYFPETTVIHYKGESTRKFTYRYMKVFYEAFSLFVKKYYPKNLRIVYLNALSIVLAVRNIINFSKHLFSIFKLFLLDTILLTAVTLWIKDFWFNNVVFIQPTESEIFFKTIPFFILLWLVSLFLNGAYDKPFSLFKAGRGMLAGTIIVLAMYGLFPMEYRFSRGIVLFSGLSGIVVLLLARWLLSLPRWIQLVPRGKVDYTAAIVSDKLNVEKTSEVLSGMHYPLKIVGRVSPDDKELKKVIGTLSDMDNIQKTYRINEFIFNTFSLSYIEIMRSMELCGSKSQFKIHVAGTNFVIGRDDYSGDSSRSMMNKRYQIGTSESKRNKRIVDILSALFLLFTYPVTAIFVNNKSGFFVNIWKVLTGKKTWVGYQSNEQFLNYLPELKESILPVYPILDGYEPNQFSKENLAKKYAEDYSALDDVRILISNLKFLGAKL